MSQPLNDFLTANLIDSINQSVAIRDPTTHALQIARAVKT